MYENQIEKLSAKVTNGVIVLDEGRALPEGTNVSVLVPVVEPPESSENPQGRTLYDRLRNVVGRANNFPEDASINVDHYLYGHQKR